MSKTIIIRADVSLQIGTGHVMRCLTLANELRGQGADVIFVCREFDANLCDYIEDKGYVVHRLCVPDTPKQNLESDLKHAELPGVDWQADAKQVKAIIKNLGTSPDWLVVDNYVLDKRWEIYLRPYVKKIMVIDDIADRGHDCDLLLDQNFYENLESRYDGLVPVGCKKRLGPKYALLRPEFWEARKTLRKRHGHVKRIMIFFGGSDTTNETAKALEAIQMLNRQDIAVDVVVGSLNPHGKVIEKMSHDLPDCTCYFNVEDMAALMARADLAVGAGGSTVWERCSLALPSIIITVAKNQEKIISDLAESGYLLFLGQSETVLAESLYHALKTALKCPWFLTSFSRKTRSLVDCKGADRIAQALMPLDITLQKATMDDCEAVYKWRNAEETRKHVFNPGQISLDKHRIWFRQSLENTNRQVLIAKLQGKTVGVLRYDIDGQSAIISIYKVPGIETYGIGTQIISAGSKWLHRYFPDVYKIQAKVFPENIASKKAFINAGYTKHNISYEEVLLDEL